VYWLLGTTHKNNGRRCFATANTN